MNQHPGVIGRKLGMTQIFQEDGTVVPCTVIESRSVVIGKRTAEKDGYDALVVGMGDGKEKHTSKAMLGVFKKAGTAPQRVVKEFRCPAEHAAKFEVGKEISLADIFEEGQMVDVQGVTRGRGFTGVMRRHGFAGNIRTHGTHEYERHGGSIGQRKTPGRTFPGMRMPGQYGNETVSIINQPVVKVIADQGLVLVRGGIPGPRNGLVVVRGAIKRGGGRKKAS